MRKKNTTFLFIVFFLVMGCSKEKKAVDDLSYLKLAEQMDANKVIEEKRTQIVSISDQANITTLVLAFAKDSKIPKGAKVTPQNNYAVRFTLHDSFERSKTFGGGTFVLKFIDVGGGNLRVRNFQKSKDRFLTRNPSYSISNMDTILNPYLINIANPTTNICVYSGCKGTLTPTGSNKNVYLIKIQMYNTQGEIWGIDHGYTNEREKTKEPYKILNQTNLGIEVSFQGHGKKASPSNYNPQTIGTI